MICPKCGKDNADGSSFCNSCGTSFSQVSKGIFCPYCGAPGQEYQFNCTKCGKELPRGLMGGSNAPSKSSIESIYSSEPFDEDAASQPESELPLAGGVLILIGGVLGLVYGGLTVAAISMAGTVGAYVPGYVTCCGLLMVLFGLIAVFGGYNGIKRESFTFALVGGILGLLSIGFFLGAFLCLIGIILIAISHNEFES